MTISKFLSFLLLATAAVTSSVQAQEGLGGETAQSVRAEQAAYRDGFSVALYIWLTY